MFEKLDNYTIVEVREDEEVTPGVGISTEEYVAKVAETLQRKHVVGVKGIRTRFAIRHDIGIRVMTYLNDNGYKRWYRFEKKED